MRLQSAAFLHALAATQVIAVAIPKGKNLWFSWWQLKGVLIDITESPQEWLGGTNGIGSPYKERRQESPQEWLGGTNRIGSPYKKREESPQEWLGGTNGIGSPYGQ